MHVGLLLDATKALAVVDRGPSPTDQRASAEWLAVWGDKSETRRFKDGAILHAAVWSASPGSRHLVVVDMARHLLRRHVGVAPHAVRGSVGGLDRLLMGPGGVGISHTTSAAISKAFDRLSSAIRNMVRAAATTPHPPPTSLLFVFRQSACARARHRPLRGRLPRPPRCLASWPSPPLHLSPRGRPASSGAATTRPFQCIGRY